MIYFVRDPSSLHLDLNGKTLILHHKNYHPIVTSGADVLLFGAFQSRYKNEPELLEYDNIVFVGTNHIITPSNRTDPIFELLFSGTRHINKISVDSVPFISQPWRTWFHFGITNTRYGIYDYSYKAETDYNKFIEDVSDYNPFSLEEMIKWSQAAVMVDYNEYFEWSIVEIQVLSSIRAAYEDLKNRLFETENSPKSVVNKLARFARESCPPRNVPQPYSIFRKPNVQIVKTDLPVDDYLVGELTNLMELTNDYLWSMNK